MNNSIYYAMGIVKVCLTTLAKSYWDFRLSQNQLESIASCYQLMDEFEKIIPGMPNYRKMFKCEIILEDLEKAGIHKQEKVIDKLLSEIWRSFGIEVEKIGHSSFAGFDKLVRDPEMEKLRDRTVRISEDDLSHMQKLRDKIVQLSFADMGVQMGMQELRDRTADLKVPSLDVCSCDIRILLSEGCKCGAIKRFEENK